MVGAAADPTERQADAMADHVLSLLAAGPSRIAPAGAGVRARQAPAPAVSRIARASRPVTAEVGAEGGAVPDDVGTEIDQQRGRGEPLHPAVRAAVEPAFGANFADVRIHRNSAAAPRLGARAFTLGSDIHIAPGESTSGQPGMRLLSHELAHVVQNSGGGEVARRTLDPEAILKVVESSKYLKGELAKSTHVQQRSKTATTPDPETMRERVRAILQEHEAMFAGDADADSLALALAIDGVAKVIASELYDPSLKPQIADQLFRVYGPSMEKAVAKRAKASKAGAASTVKVARAIAGGDPLSLYMHREMRLEEAALEIQRMATAAAKTEKEMFDLLSRRFQAEMASYSMKTVKAQEDQGRVDHAYNTKESSGELSAQYLKGLFGDVQEDATMPKKTSGKELAFSPAATAKLTALQQAVDKAAAGNLGYTPPKTAQERRDRYLQDVADADAAVTDQRTADLMTVLQGHEWKLTKGQAKELIHRLKDPATGLRMIPLTVTHWAGRRTADKKDGSKFDKKDRTRAGETTKHVSKELIGKKHTKARKALPTDALNSAGKYTDPMFAEERGERYLQFRKWKDRMMTGNLGFEDEELPTFGAANIFFEQTKGTGSGPRKPDAIYQLNKKKRAGHDLTPDEQTLLDSLTAEWNRLEKLTDDQKTGVNYYGDMHLKLIYDRVKDRIVYTAGDHGNAHRDPFLAFVDFAVGSTTDYRSDVTGLKGDAGTKSVANAKAVANTILGRTDVWAMELPFEIQIHGGVDWETDVEEIWVSPSVPADARKRLDDWSTQRGGNPAIKVVPTPAQAGVRVAASFKAAQAGLDASLSALPER